MVQSIKTQGIVSHASCTGCIMDRVFHLIPAKGRTTQYSTNGQRIIFPLVNIDVVISYDRVDEHEQPMPVKLFVPDRGHFRGKITTPSNG